MRVFVTGGTGFIGSHFLREAIGRGWGVTALRRGVGSRPRISLAREPDWIEGGLTADWSRELSACDALVHFAAAGVSPKPVEWHDAFQVNVLDSLALWRQAAAAGVKRFVICGSCFEYGRSGERYDFIPPDAPLEPIGRYAASKAAATMAALGLAAELSLNLSVLRPFHVFGEGADPTSFWGQLVTAAQSGNDFPMTPGQQIRDLMDASAVARVFADALVRSAAPGYPVRVQNVGTGQPVTLADFARSAWATLGAAGNLRIGDLPYRSNEVMRYVPQL